MSAPAAKKQKVENATFAPNGVIFADDPDGPSSKAIITCGGAKVEVYLFGAHVFSWQAGGAERLWMSGLSKMDGSAPLRGGVPLAFPQFADMGEVRGGRGDLGGGGSGMNPPPLPPQLPLHGFARTSLWTVTDVDHDDDSTSLTLSLSDSPETRAVWDHPFVRRARWRVRDGTLPSATPRLTRNSSTRSHSRQAPSS